MFEGKSLNRALKEAEAHIIKEYNKNEDNKHVQQNAYDKIDMKRVLFESGLVGQLNEIKPKIKSGHKKFCNPCEMIIITASFEYQIKGGISFMNDGKYVIHPMCYEHYRCYVDENTLVYPDKIDGEGDVLDSFLLEE